MPLIQMYMNSKNWTTDIKQKEHTKLGRLPEMNMKTLRDKCRYNKIHCVKFSNI